MARCIDCLHFDVCKHSVEELCKWTKIEDLIHNCSKFKDSTNHVEVVRCKDCKHYMLWEDSEDKRTCGKAIGLMVSDPDDFCSYGERR